MWSRYYCTIFGGEYSHPLAGELKELIDFDDELVEKPTIASLCGVDTTAQFLEESTLIH